MLQATISNEGTTTYKEETDSDSKGMKTEEKSQTIYFLTVFLSL